MNLFLIGCTGFIGRELITQLVKAEHKLTILSRKEKIQTLKNITQLRLDPTNLSTWEQDSVLNHLSKSDGIINLVVEPIADKRWTKSHCSLMTSSRIKATQGLVQAISKLKKSPKVLINASAIGFYGTSLEKKFTEESIGGNDFLANLCNEWEECARRKPRSTRLVLIRIGIVLGPDGGALGKMLPVFKAGLGGPIGNGQQWMSWIHRTDLCKLIEQTLTNKKWSGIINAVAPNPVKMVEFSNTLGKTLGRPSLLPIPSQILKLILGDGAKLVLEGQHVQSIRLSKLGFKFTYPHLSEALASATQPIKH